MFSKRKNILWLIFALLLIAGLFFSNRFLQKKGYSGLIGFTTQYIVNRSKAEAPKRKLEIIISDSAYKKINEARERAIKLGVIIPDTNAYVPCTVVVDGQKLKAEFRLKGKMLDHVEGDKWSFRVKIKDKGNVWGMKKFSIQHPGTRNYIYDWVYHEFSKSEGIVALNYFFIGVSINGEDKGVYALEEHFSEELLTHNNRVTGPLFRFNPDLFWEFRVNELKGVLLNDEQTRFQSADIDFFDKDELLSKKTSSVHLQEALLLMENFRRGQLKASQVLDVPLFAKRHAILDIIGGHHSVDWSDIKFYYNPASKKIEPISYESFSANQIESILGEFRCRKPNGYFQDFHDALFSDPEFFTSYIQCLDKMAEPEYLQKFFSSIESEFNYNKNVLFAEYPYKEFNAEIYLSNCKKIRDVLSPQQMLQAYLSDPGKLKVAGISSLPCVLNECVINDSVHLPVSGNNWVYCKSPDDYPKYHEYIVKGLEGLALTEKDQVVLRYSIPGLKNQLQVLVHNEKYPDLNQVDRSIFTKESNVASFDNLVVDSKNRRVFLNTEELLIDHDLILPDSFLFVLQTGQKLILQNNSKVLFKGGLSAKANVENPILIQCKDSSACSFYFSNHFSKVDLNFVYFQNFGRLKMNTVFTGKSLLNFYRSTVNMSNCTFINCNTDLIQCAESKLSLRNFYQNGLNKAFMNAFASEVKCENLKFVSAKDELFSVENSKLIFYNCSFNSCEKNILDASSSCLINLFDCEFSGIKTPIKISKGTVLNGRNVTGKDLQTFVKVKNNSSYDSKAKVVFLNSIVEAKNFAQANPKELIFYNGKRVESKEDENEK